MLASIQKIKNINVTNSVHSAAIVQAGAWQAFAPGNVFKVGDTCVFVKRGSLVPDHVKGIFLEPYATYIRERNSFLICNTLLCGDFSQGIILPLNIIDSNVATSLKTGQDVTNLLGIKPFYKSDASKSCIIELQDNPKLNAILKKKKYFIATLPDGIEVTIQNRNLQLNIISDEVKTSPYITASLNKYIKSKNLLSKMNNCRCNISINGYFCGPGIGSNIMNLSEHSFFVREITNTDLNIHLDLTECLRISLKLQLPSVHMEEIGDNFDYSLKDIVGKSRGRLTNGSYKKGIIVSAADAFSQKNQKKIPVFKILNDYYIVNEFEKIKNIENPICM